MPKTIEAKPHESSITGASTNVAFPIPKIIKMTPQEWIAVSDNPRQRDTERHLRRAKHLLSPSPTHAQVSMAQCGKQSWKLDGHTRALLWTQQPDLAPPTIYVTVYSVLDEEEAKILYTHFDAKEALETSADKVYGAFNEIGWIPQTAYLCRGVIVTGLLKSYMILHGNPSGEVGFSKDTERYPNTYTLVAFWQNELKALDEINPQRDHWNNSILGAALLTLRKRPGRAKEFWNLYELDKGVKLEDQVDGVEAANRITINTRLGKGVARSSTGVVYNLSRYVSCFESWHRGHIYKLPLMVKQTNLGAYTKDIQA